MFIEKFKRYKKILGESEVYENNSYDKNNLFVFPEMLEETDVVLITADEMESYYKELIKLNDKYSFIKSYLEEELKLLKQDNKKLDSEYLEMNGIDSKDGIAFLKMMNNNTADNHIPESVIHYLKNAEIVNGIIHRTNESISPVPFYLKHENDNNFFIIFEEPTEFKELLLDFHKPVIYSVAGIKEDGTTEILFTDVNSETYPIVMNNTEDKFLKLLIFSNYNTKHSLKSLNVYDRVDGNSNSIVCYRLPDINSLSSIEIVSTSDTETFILTLEEYKNFLTTVVSDEELALTRFLNNSTRVMKNTKIKTDSFEKAMIVVEKLLNTSSFAETITIYGVEK